MPINKTKTYLIDAALKPTFPAVAKGNKIEFMMDGAEVIMQVNKVTPS